MGEKERRKEKKIHTESRGVDLQESNRATERG